MSALDGIETTLRRWGVPVLTDDVVPGRPGLFTPSHVMVHHTASNPPGAAPSHRVVREGRGAALPGPLCHLLVRRDHKVELVTRGRANHAGLGGPWVTIPKDAGNRFCLGIEIEHAGTDKEPWTPSYMAFCRLVEAACFDHLSQPATRLLAHKEWAPSRKIDPWRWDMPAERRAVGVLLGAGPPTDDLLEELMALDPNSAEYRRFVADVAAAVLTTQRPLMGYAKTLLEPKGDGTMSLEQAAQHGAAQAFAANTTAGNALDAAVQARTAAEAALAAVKAISTPLP